MGQDSKLKIRFIYRIALIFFYVMLWLIVLKDIEERERVAGKTYQESMKQQIANSNNTNEIELTEVVDRAEEAFYSKEK